MKPINISRMHLMAFIYLALAWRKVLPIRKLKSQ